MSRCGVGFFAASGVAGTFPVVEATNTGNGSSGTSYAVPLPAGIAAGDLLVIIVGVNATATLTTPSGWTQLANAFSGTQRLAVYYKIASGSEGSTVSVTASASASWATNSYRISNYQGTPEAGTPATGSSTAPNPPSLSPSWGSAKTLWIAAAANNGAASFSGTPANYGNQITGSASLVKTTSVRRELEASSDDSGAFTLSSSNVWVAHTIAIRPA